MIWAAEWEGEPLGFGSVWSDERHIEASNEGHGFEIGYDNW